MSRVFLSAIAALGAAITALPARAALPPAGMSFTLTVTSSFQPSFKDCWSFLSGGHAIVAKSSLGSFPYQLDGLNTQANAFQAVWQGHNSIGFSGTTGAGAISGNGVDSYGRTYAFTGTEVASCAGQPVAARGFATK